MVSAVCAMEISEDVTALECCSISSPGGCLLIVEYECRYCHESFKPITFEELEALIMHHAFGLCLRLLPLPLEDLE
jgi:hypothetical protein